MSEYLQKLEAICAEVYGRWDKDMRSGKLLAALAGTMPNYRSDVDEVRAALSAAGGPYLIWSNEHQAWWRPNSAGYTMNVEDAGRYPRGRAIEIASGSRDGWFIGGAPPEIAISEADVLAMAHRRREPRQRRA